MSLSNPVLGQKEQCEIDKNTGRKNAFQAHKTFKYIYCSNSIYEFNMPIDMMDDFANLYSKDSIVIEPTPDLINLCEWEGYKEVCDSIFYSNFPKNYFSKKKKQARKIWEERVLDEGIVSDLECENYSRKKTGSDNYRSFMVSQYLIKNTPDTASFFFSNGSSFNSYIFWKIYVDETGIIDSLKIYDTVKKFNESDEDIEMVSNCAKELLVGKKLFEPCVFCKTKVRTYGNGMVSFKWK